MENQPKKDKIRIYLKAVILLLDEPPRYGEPVEDYVKRVEAKLMRKTHEKRQIRYDG